MSRILVQPIGQKRLTNVAVVRLKKHGHRFEIACYKNKVLSWRSGVEKDLDEVLQSQTVYTNVSKGVLAKSKDLIQAFGNDDHSKICLEILDKGELQVAGKERESQMSNQFRDIATIVMEKTYNPETQRPYTISMIERLMRDIHLAVDPNSNSKKQALEVIQELQKHFPIKRSPMKLRLTVSDQGCSSIMEKLNSWDAKIVSNDQSGTQHSIICELDPGFYRDCEALMVNSQGRFEVLALSVHAEGDSQAVDHYDDDAGGGDSQPPPPRGPAEKSESSDKLSEKLQKQSISTSASNTGEAKQSKCSTCNAGVGDTKQFREHFKSEWHKHNLRRKAQNLGPLTEQECASDVEISDSRADLKEYSF